MTDPQRTPQSTYRFQVTADQDLFHVARRLPYLRDLGVDWVYLSPLLAAEPGSDHGYDVVAHDHLDASRGGAEGLAAVSAKAHQRGMGLLVDIVPNHVGIATPHEDPWWWDVLARGRDSDHEVAFDVDWDAGDGKIRIPVIGDDDRSPDGGPVGHLELHPAPSEGTPTELRYFDHRFPVAPGSLDGLDLAGDPAELAQVVHERQHYELVNWRVADDGLNYRRFFAVNELAAVRVEDPEVFADSHVEIKRWFDEGLVDGLRVDHPDGLRDPKGYLDDLAELTGGAYVLVEKITEPGEELPRSWATAGTTGYDALALIDRVLTDPAGQEPLDALEARLRGGPVDWERMIHDTKRTVADTILHSEVRRITREVRALRPDLGFPAVEDAVAELLACFPVYRSYLPEGREHLDHAHLAAREHRPDLQEVLDEVVEVLADPANDPALRFQQTSGMVMAKGVEDCAFYRYSRLTSLNEVGGDPSVFAHTPAEFHAALAQRQHERPHAMTTLSTHDTKRGEDVRARIGVLAEIPDVWASTLDRLLGLTPLPDPGFAALLWQAVVGAWPAGGTDAPNLRARLHAYAEKAMREAGDRTTWTAPDEQYETAVHRAGGAVFEDRAVHRTVAGLVERIAGPGWSNALAAKLLALTMPGVPDVYQGSELWEQSLVDPDNRRRVDLDLRVDLLSAIRDGARTPLTDSPDDPGTAKLRVVHGALTLRRERPELFASYAPLAAEGEAASHALAFDRGGAVTVVTRLPVGLAARGGWGETTLRLPAGEWREVLNGRTGLRGAVPLGELLADLPVALLERTDD